MDGRARRGQGDPVAADVVRADHAIGSGAAQPLFEGGGHGAGHDEQARIQLAGGEHAQDVVGVGIQAGDEAVCPLDPGPLEDSSWVASPKT